MTPKKKVIISVSDKTKVVNFARELIKLNYEILSTGGTYDTLIKQGIKATKVEDFTGFKEMMDGRVKTLHPKIHGGILGDRTNESHVRDAKDSNVEWIEMVVVNLYPFEEVVKNSESSHEEIIENIDIGGPTLLRAAAKNFKCVTVLVDPNDYDLVIKEIKKNGEVNLDSRKRLACKAFERSAAYDEEIVHFMREMCGKPEIMNLHYEKVRSLRYGENPHQKAAFFKNPHNSDSNVTNAEQLHGLQLSFNNIVDADAAIELVKEFTRPTVVFIKHNNPCGVASSEKVEKAFELAHMVDPMSAFGGVIAMNRTCTKKIVDYISEKKLFVEIIIAPNFEKTALAELMKKQNLRILELGKLKLDKERRDIKKVAGGILIQSADTSIIMAKDLKIVTKKKPTKNQIEALLFARKVVKHVKSNAVIFAKVDEKGNDIVTAIGAGQMSRVDSVHIAVHKGGKNVEGSVMASDAFFPFADALEQAAKAGAVAFLQPGGSIRDKEVTQRADELGVSMVYTGIRSFKH